MLLLIRYIYIFFLSLCYTVCVNHKHPPYSPLNGLLHSPYLTLNPDLTSARLYPYNYPHPPFPSYSYPSSPSPTPNLLLLLPLLLLTHHPPFLPFLPFTLSGRGCCSFRLHLLWPPPSHPPLYDIRFTRI